MSLGLNFEVRAFIGYVNYENSLWEYTPFQIYLGLAAGSLVILVLVIVCSCKFANKCMTVECPSPDGIVVDYDVNSLANYLISPAEEAYFNMHTTQRRLVNRYRQKMQWYYSAYSLNSGQKGEAGDYLEQCRGGEDDDGYMTQSTKFKIWRDKQNTVDGYLTPSSTQRANRNTVDGYLTPSSTQSGYRNTENKGYLTPRSKPDLAHSKQWHNQRQGDLQPTSSLQPNPLHTRMTDQRKLNFDPTHIVVLPDSGCCELESRIKII